MCSRSTSALVCLALVAVLFVRAVSAADPPPRKPLGIDERNAVLNLIKAVDVAQETDVTAGDRVTWDGHVLRSGNQTAYLPFRLMLNPADSFKAAVVYVRAVSRHDGMRARDERSVARDWLLRGNSVPPRLQTVYVSTGELPVGGPASRSSRETVSGPNQALTVLALQQRELERQKAAADAAKKQQSEAKARNPLIFPFEDYYVADLTRDGDRSSLDRALSLPPGEYDVYVGMIDRAKLKTSGPVIVRRTVTVPDFWNDEMAVSSLILASDVRMLPAAPSAKQQAERPYSFGRAEVVPVASAVFAATDALTVVYQICNYGAPDADLQAEYNFYRLDGAKVLFNRTPPQHFGDEDLPAPAPWETVAFATQTVSLQTFPPGRYELEVIVRDRLTRRSASGSVAFTVAPR